MPIKSAVLWSLLDVVPFLHFPWSFLSAMHSYKIHTTIVSLILSTAPPALHQLRAHWASNDGWQQRSHQFSLQQDQWSLKFSRSLFFCLHCLVDSACLVQKLCCFSVHLCILKSSLSLNFASSLRIQMYVGFLCLAAFYHSCQLEPAVITIPKKLAMAWWQ